MSRKHNRAENRLSNYTAYAVCLAVAFLWIARKKFDFDIPTLMVFTGIAIIILTALFQNRKRLKENQRTAEKLKQQREEMTSDIFDEKNYFD